MTSGPAVTCMPRPPIGGMWLGLCSRGRSSRPCGGRKEIVMLLELREYVAAPGRAADLHARFADHTMALFAKHGMEVVGFWTDAEDEGRIIYLLRFASLEAK